MNSSLSRSALENDKWFNFCSSINYNVWSQVLYIPQGICCDFKPTLSESTMPKTISPTECYIEDLCSSINDVSLNEEIDVDSSSSEGLEDTDEGITLPNRSTSKSVRKEHISDLKSSWRMRCSLPVLGEKNNFHHFFHFKIYFYFIFWSEYQKRSA
jgi:hypothetical protein